MINIYMTSMNKIWKSMTFILSNQNNFHSLGSCGARERDTTSKWVKTLNKQMVVICHIMLEMRPFNLLTAKLINLNFPPTWSCEVSEK